MAVRKVRPSAKVFKYRSFRSHSYKLQPWHT